MRGGHFCGQDSGHGDENHGIYSIEAELIGRVQTQRSFGDSGRADGTVLLPFNEQLHINWRHEPHVVFNALSNPVPMGDLLRRPPSPRCGAAAPSIIGSAWHGTPSG